MRFGRKTVLDTDPPKKRQKVFTDYDEYIGRKNAYSDSLALNDYHKMQLMVEPREQVQDKAAYDAMQELVRSGQRDTSEVADLRAFGDKMIEKSDGRLQWAGGKSSSYSPDLQYYSIQDDPNASTFSKALDKLTTNSFGSLINGADQFWLGNAYNAVWPEPNVEPVYVEEQGRQKANEFTKDMNEKVDSLYNTPGALDKFQNKVMKDMLAKGVPADTSFYDSNLGATVSAGIYDPADPNANGSYSYFKVSTSTKPKPSPVSKVFTSRPKEELVKLPTKAPKLPRPSVLNQTPKLPEIYSRKLNQRTQEYIYETSAGTLRKKVGREDGDFVKKNRKLIDNMRKNR